MAGPFKKDDVSAYVGFKKKEAKSHASGKTDPRPRKWARFRACFSGTFSGENSDEFPGSDSGSDPGYSPGSTPGSHQGSDK